MGAVPGDGHGEGLGQGEARLDAESLLGQGSIEEQRPGLVQMLALLMRPGRAVSPLLIPISIPIPIPIPRLDQPVGDPADGSGIRRVGSEIQGVGRSAPPSKAFP